jgi:hypothetical protein
LGITPLKVLVNVTLLKHYKVMEIKETIGIDVSKATLDVCIHSTGDKGKFANNTNGFKKLIAWNIGNNFSVSFVPVALPCPHLISHPGPSHKSVWS